MWNKITVGKYQQLYDILQGQNFEHAVDKQIHLLSCLTGKSVEYYEAVPFVRLQRDHLPAVSFLSSDPPAASKPPRYLNVAGKRFKVCYDFRDLCAGQFIDVMSIAKTPGEIIINLDKLLAAICLPVEKGWLKTPKIRQYGYIPFETVADCMLAVPITDAMAVAGFFSEAWNAFLKVIPGYLRRRTQRTGKLPTEAEMVVYQVALLSVGDGC